MYRWLISINGGNQGNSFNRTIVHINKRKIINIDKWSKEYAEESKLESVIILNVEKLRPIFVPK